MQGSTKISITDLNAYITCKICNGYFVDASTIIECLHTFCRSCIIKYLQKNKYCPVCDVQVHKSKPLLNIRPDKTLQDIVYKLVPRLFQNEMQRRREFYENHPEAKPSSLEQCGEVAYQYLLTPEETICLTLSYHGADNKPRYLRCPAAVTMGHLKKLIRAKYDLSENHRVDILYNQDCLNPSLTLMDIAYIYLWKRKGPIELTYRIYENTAKRLKIEHPGGDKTGTNNINNNNLSNNNNWKEVQLRISENGEMSITGIQDSPLSPSLLEIVNSDSKYKNDGSPEESKIGSKPIQKKELPGLKYIGKANTPPLVTTTMPDPNIITVTSNYSNTTSIVLSTLCIPPISDHLSVSLASTSSNCATLSSGSTTMVFSTINTMKCSTKSEESSIQPSKPVERVDKEVEKSLKRKMESNPETEPLAKQPKPIILNHNISLLNLSNNHPLKKHSMLNRNGENVQDLPRITTDSENKTTDTTTQNSNILEASNKKIVIKSNVKLSGRPGTPTSKPLAMRAKTLISETGVKPPCYQPRTVYSPLINVPRPATTVSNITLTPKTEIRTQPLVSTPQKVEKPTNTTQSLHINQNSTPKVSQANQMAIKSINVANNNRQQNCSPTPTASVANKAPNISQTQFSLSGNNKASSTTTSQAPQNKIQGITNNIPTSNPSQGMSTKPPTMVSISTSQPSQNSVNKIPNSTIKTKPSTPIGYKTLRDPPKSWNSQISKANISKSSPDQKYSDLKNIRPAKFFKMRNVPRYLGNPASGVKPMYQVHVSPEKDKPSECGKIEKTEIKKHSIVKIDPKTLKPISEKAPETTSLSNHSTMLQTPNLNAHIIPTSQIYTSNINQCLNSTPTTMHSGGLNMQNDLKITTSSVSIINPLKLQGSPKNERKSPKSPHSPKLKTSSPPIGNKRDNKINRNFTPPNPFVPNIPSKTLSPNQFIYPAMPSGFPPYDPRLMAAYYNQWYGQRLSFPPSSMPGLSLDQRKSLEILASAGSPKMDALTQSVLNHQMPSRPTVSTSTNMSSIQKSPLSPTVTKPVPALKKTAKDTKNDKSLETVVGKMTQNRNKMNKAPNDTPTPTKKEDEVDKMKVQQSAPSADDDGSKDQKSELQKVDNASDQMKIENSVEQKIEEENVEQKSSNTPKLSEQTEKVLKMPEKENSDTQNHVQGNEESNVVIENKEKTVCGEEITKQVEVKGKE